MRANVWWSAKSILPWCVETIFFPWAVGASYFFAFCFALSDENMTRGDDDDGDMMMVVVIMVIMVMVTIMVMNAGNINSAGATPSCKARHQGRVFNIPSHLLLLLFLLSSAPGIYISYFRRSQGKTHETPNPKNTRTTVLSRSVPSHLISSRSSLPTPVSVESTS